MSEHLVEDLNSLFAEALRERDEARAQCAEMRRAGEFALDFIIKLPIHEKDHLSSWTNTLRIDVEDDLKNALSTSADVGKGWAALLESSEERELLLLNDVDQIKDLTERIQADGEQIMHLLEERDKLRAQCAAIRTAGEAVLAVCNHPDHTLRSMKMVIQGSSLVALRAALDRGETG